MIYTCLYVLPFYLSPTTRPSRTLSRDAPTVIRARVASVSLTCAVCSAITLLILTSRARATYAEALHSMGWWPVGLSETARSLLLTAALFAGPLYESLVVHRGWRDWVRLEPVRELLREWTTWRNIVAVSSIPSTPFSFFLPRCPAPASAADPPPHPSRARLPRRCFSARRRCR